MLSFWPSSIREVFFCLADFTVIIFVEIRLPFVWKERQYFKDRSHKADNYGKKFVVFCILYTDQDMQSTQKVMVDSSMADVVFPELIEL